MKLKTDTTLRQDVLAELAWDPAVREKEIAVAVKDGVVTLGGFVDSYAQKWAAERAVRRIAGVRAISEQLLVRLPNGSVRSDTELAHKVADALRWDIDVPDDRIRATVESGWVTLDGDVQWRFESEAAERAVRNLTGITGLTNLIAVRPVVAQRDVERRIREALHRHADEEAAAVRIAAKGNEVTLEGRAHSWSARADIERAAWSAPGVARVHDHILVGA